jgi:predicted short-subunit dehydrogenase-like oxidoreductase (DUF2520 family)
LKSIKSISFIGSGNVATHLAYNFFNNGFTINEIFSKSKENAEYLASKTNALASNSINQINTISDIYIISIKDDVINDVIRELPFKNKLIVHTSGSTPMSILKDFDNYGIFYPLQTFSKEKNVNMAEVPFCIEASNNNIQQLLLDLGKTISKNVCLINSEQRKKLHLAAVFACNFTNYMYQIANDITSENNVDFNILRPLILETAKKIQENSPASMQTGPAIRNDEEVINNHLEQLANSKSYQEIYKIITKSIIKKTNGQF